MSTKVTWLFGRPEIHEGNDYHLYYDYADGKIHLEIRGEEVPLPPKLERELRYIHSLYEAVLGFAGIVKALVEHVGTDKAYASIIRDIGPGAFGVLNNEEEEDEDFDVDELVQRVKDIEEGREFFYDEREVREFLELGYHQHVILNDSGIEAYYYYDVLNGRIIVAFVSDGSVDVRLGLEDALQYLSEHNVSQRDMRKFLATATEFLRAQEKEGE